MVKLYSESISFVKWFMFIISLTPDLLEYLIFIAFPLYYDFCSSEMFLREGQAWERGKFIWINIHRQQG